MVAPSKWLAQGELARSVSFFARLSAVRKCIVSAMPGRLRLLRAISNPDPQFFSFALAPLEF